MSASNTLVRIPPWTKFHVKLPSQSSRSRHTREHGSAKKRTGLHGSARKRTGSARKRQGSARKSRQKEGSTKKIGKMKETGLSDDTDMKAVRRNLFMADSKLERRQSVAVMENLISPRQRGSRHIQKNSPQRSPRVKSNTPNLVAETPAHKQLSKRLVRRSESRRETGQGSVAPVVEESPMKQSSSPVNSLLKEKRINAVVKCPVKSPTNVALPRRTFYSAGPRNRSRNMEKYRQLADRIAGRTPSSKEKLKSPARQFVLKQLKGSPSPSHSLRRTPRKLEITPVKGWATTLVVDSPSQNTRSRTPSRSSAKLVLYQDQHARPKSGRTPRKETVTRKLALSLTPEKLGSQRKTPEVTDIPQGSITPKQTGTSSKVNASLSEEKLSECVINNSLDTPKWDGGIGDHSTDCISILNSPCQNTRSRTKPSPGALLCRHMSFDIKSSGIKPSMGIRNLSFDLDLCQDNSSVRKGLLNSQSNPVTPIKESPNNSMVSSEKTPQKLIESTPRKSCLKTPNHHQSASKSPHGHRDTPPTPASILKKTGFSPGFEGLSPRPVLKVRWKEDELSKVSNFNKRMAEAENLALNRTNKKDHYENSLMKVSVDDVDESSSDRHRNPSPQANLGEVKNTVDQTSAKPPRTDMTTPSPSPVKRVRVKTPDTLDQWPRRKPRFGCERGSSTSPKTQPQQSSISPVGSDKSGPTFRSENTTSEHEISGKRRRHWRPSSSKVKSREVGSGGTDEGLKMPKHSSFGSENQGTVPSSKRVLISRQALHVSPEDSCAGQSSTQDCVPKSVSHTLKPVALSFNMKSIASCGASDSESSFNESLQRKRVLPDAFGEQTSPSKRPRTARQQKSMSDLHQRIVQHEHDSRNASSTGLPSHDFSSINTLSQSEDYFSSINEEVFLSDKSAPSSVFESSPNQFQTDPVSPSKYPINSALSSLQSVQSNNSPKFPRLGTLRNFKGKTLSSGSESGLEPADSNSPIFSPKQSTPFVRRKSNNLIKNCAGVKAASKNLETDAKSQSPIKESTGRKNQASPPNMKTFSPNVSAKGLLQLMNSPLLRSGPGQRNSETMEEMDLDASLISFSASHDNRPAINTRKRRKVVARSRRSLNLFN